jgi:phosphoribosyl-ATP pyrophosphohydrolase/phosphoribosyl-AMP cyclohydrolase
MIDFEKSNGLVPAIVQDARNQQVLMLGYLNEESWGETLRSGKLCFYSRSKKRLWTKGEESGNFLHLRSYKIDCDKDTVLLLVEPAGKVCHRGTDTCFGDISPRGFSGELAEVISARLSDDSEGSYTAALAARGTSKVAQKVGEEAVELVIEALKEKDDQFLAEAADLFYHYLLLLKMRGYGLEDVEMILKERHLAKA